MTRSARGTMESPGRNVAQKAGLNRSILDTAPARFHAMLRTKAEEAGSEVVEAPTRTLRPTQRCHACWQLPERRKTLSERTHACGCGTTCDRDENAARVLLRWMQEQDGARDGPADRAASAARLETPCAAA